MNRVCDTLVTRILLWTVSEATSWLAGHAREPVTIETNVAMTPAISAKYEAGSADFDADIAPRARRAGPPRGARHPPVRGELHDHGRPRQKEEARARLDCDRVDHARVDHLRPLPPEPAAHVQVEDRDDARRHRRSEE